MWYVRQREVEHMAAEGRAYRGKVKDIFNKTRDAAGGGVDKVKSILAKVQK